jgi:hypothetical protein
MPNHGNRMAAQEMQKLASKHARDAADARKRKDRKLAMEHDWYARAHMNESNKKRRKLKDYR